MAVCGLVAVFDRPPLVDWPQHMARHHIELLAITGRPLPAGYSIDWTLTPNLASDIVVPLLMLVLPPLAASKVYLIASVLLFVGGAAALFHQTARSTKAARFATLLVVPWALNPVLFWGFLNNYFANGVALLAIGYLLWIDRTNRHQSIHSLVLAALVMALPISHLASFGSWGLVIGAWFISRLMACNGDFNPGNAPMRSLVLSCVTALPAVLMLGYVVLLSEHSALHGGINFVGIGEKLRMLYWPFMGYNHRTYDLALFACWLVAVGFLFRWREVRWHWLGLAFAMLLVAYFLLPEAVGTTSIVYPRLLPVIVVVGIAYAATLPIRELRWAVLLAGAIGAARVALVAWNWSGLAAEIDENRTCFAKMQAESRVFPVNLEEVRFQKPQITVLGWGVIERRLFVPTLLAIPGQQPLRLDVERLPGDRSEWISNIRKLAVGYDYLWVYNPHRRPTDVPDEWPLICSSGNVSLFRIGNP